MHVSRLTALPVAILVAAGLTACGGEPAAAPSPSPTKAVVAESPTPTPTPTVEELTAANFVARATAGEATATSYDVAVSVTGAATMEMTGSADLAGGKHNVAIHLTDPDVGPIEIRFVDGLLYVNIAEIGGGLFYQVDPNDAANPLAEAFGDLGEVLSSAFEGMDQAVTSVTKVGAPEVLDGVEVQAYQVVVDSTKITPDVAQGMLEDEGLTVLPPTLTYTHWLDAQDVPRKSSYELNGTTTTVVFTHVGAGTPVTVPPAEQVTTEIPF